MRRRIAVIILAMLAISSFSFLVNLAGADFQFQGTWVRMRGIVTHWGSTPVFGFIDAHAGMTNVNGTQREWARVHAIWSYERRRLNFSEPPPQPENFTFTFYAAKLVESSEISLNHSGYNFYISGLWNVVNITTTILVDENGSLISFTRTIEPIATNATGELRVLDTWTKFELSIEGIDLLSGFVVGVFIKHVEIKICDINDDGKVDIIDLVKVAKRYRTVPGLWGYVHDMDFNFDNVIDIGDLTTVAANIEG